MGPRTKSLIKEIHKQSTAGSQITTKPAAKLLDKLFMDDALSEPASMKQHPSAAFATPTLKLASGPSYVKGLPNVYLHAIFKRGLTLGPKHIENDHMRVTYLPPWHALASGRTTRPAISVCYSSSITFNGQKVPKELQSKKTFDYAVWRYKAKFVYKKLFMNAWNELMKTENGPRDGAYIFLVKKYPEEEHRAGFEKLLYSYLEDIALPTTRLDWASRTRAQGQVVSPNALEAVGLTVPKLYTEQEWNWGYVK